MVDGQRRITAWRQGSVLSHQAAAELALEAEGGPEQTVVVVVSHDCDIASDCDREPYVEVIVGRRIERLGANTHSKNPRSLHLAFASNEGEVPVELRAVAKVSVPKDRVLPTEPRPGWILTPASLVILSRWLASRVPQGGIRR